jgi:deoxyadenosine/deoxycytidine kinase
MTLEQGASFMKPIISIAGTVGAGKSTLTHALSNHFQFQASFEKVNGNPYLEDYYRNFEKWSFHLQVYFLTERFKEQKRMVEQGGGFVQDRSIYEDKDIFAKSLFEKGLMSPRDYETYQSLFDCMVLTPYFPKPDCLVYLTGTFDDIVHRVKERGRDMEQNTDISYWNDLYVRYENWIDSFSICPVVRVNINEYDLLNEPESLLPIVHNINKIIEPLHLKNKR